MPFFVSDTVCCDVCNYEVKVTGNNFPLCQSVDTICSNRLLLPKPVPGKKYVRWQCECYHSLWFKMLPEHEMEFKCDCSQAFKIATNSIGEVRCNQIVYRANLAIPNKEIIDKLREEVKKMKEDNQNFQNITDQLRDANQKLTTERDELREEMRKLENSGQQVLVLEKSLKDKEEENQFLREIVKNTTSLKGKRRSRMYK